MQGQKDPVGLLGLCGIENNTDDVLECLGSDQTGWPGMGADSMCHMPAEFAATVDTSREAGVSLTASRYIVISDQQGVGFERRQTGPVDIESIGFMEKFCGKNFKGHE